MLRETMPSPENVTEEALADWLLQPWRESEFEICSAEQMRSRLDSDVLRFWYDAHLDAEAAHKAHNNACRTQRLLRHLMRRLRSIQMTPGLPGAQCHPAIQRLSELHEEGMIVTDRLWQKVTEANDQCFDLSRHMFRPAEKVVQPKAEKDWARLEEYWLKKLCLAEQRLERSQGKLHGLERQVRAVYGENDLTASFHLGMVGGGGNPRGIHRLNRKKERQADRFFRLNQELDESKARVRRLKCWVEKCQQFYDRAVEKNGGVEVCN